MRGILKDGYRLQIDRTKLPSEYYEKNNKSALDNVNFVGEEIKKLVSRGCIIRLDQRPRICNPLTVASKGNKLRLVLDLSRCINLLIMDTKFKLDDIKVATEMITGGEFMVVSDLRSAYHNVRVNPDDYELYGFKFEVDGSIQWFCFVVLPFGLSLAAHVITRLTKPLIALALSLIHI